jgi:CRP-like cAMP-binding protein
MHLHKASSLPSIQIGKGARNRMPQVMRGFSQPSQTALDLPPAQVLRPDAFDATWDLLQPHLQISPSVRSVDTIDAIANILVARCASILSQLNVCTRQSLRQFARFVTSQTAPPHQIVVQEASIPSSVYVVMSGSLLVLGADLSHASQSLVPSPIRAMARTGMPAIRSPDVLYDAPPPRLRSRKAKTLRRIGPGATFGEVGLLLRRAPPVSVITETPVCLLALDVDAFDLSIGPMLRAHFEERRDALRGVLAFDSMSDDARDYAAAQSHILTFAPGESIFREGDPASALYVGLAGVARVLKRASADTLRLFANAHATSLPKIARGSHVVTLSEDMSVRDWVLEAPALSQGGGGVHSATVVAATSVRVVVVPLARLKEIATPPQLRNLARAYPFIGDPSFISFVVAHRAQHTGGSGGGVSFSEMCEAVCERIKCTLEQRDPSVRWDFFDDAGG